MHFRTATLMIMSPKHVKFDIRITVGFDEGNYPFKLSILTLSTMESDKGVVAR